MTMNLDEALIQRTNEVDRLRAANAALEKRIAELEAALRPFAKAVETARGNGYSPTADTATFFYDYNGGGSDDYTSFTGLTIGDFDAAVAILSGSTSALDAYEYDVRKYLWLNHGHGGLYGDDGEMQCGKCAADFKRQPLIDLMKKALDAAKNAAIQDFLTDPAVFLVLPGQETYPAHNWAIEQCAEWWRKALDAEHRRVAEATALNLARRAKAAGKHFISVGFAEKFAADLRGGKVEVPR